MKEAASVGLLCVVNCLKPASSAIVAAAAYKQHYNDDDE